MAGNIEDTNDFEVSTGMVSDLLVNFDLHDPMTTEVPRPPGTVRQSLEPLRSTHGVIKFADKRFGGFVKAMMRDYITKVFASLNLKIWIETTPGPDGNTFQWRFSLDESNYQTTRMFRRQCHKANRALHLLRAQADAGLFDNMLPARRQKKILTFLSNNMELDSAFLHIIMEFLTTCLGVYGTLGLTHLDKDARNTYEAGRSSTKELELAPPSPQAGGSGTSKRGQITPPRGPYEACHRVALDSPAVKKNRPSQDQEEEPGQVKTEDEDIYAASPSSTDTDD